MRSGKLLERSTPTARGFTLIEVIVTLLIISVLAALLIPAVLAIRESSRRMTCANNLHQFGIAIHSHISANRTFPQGVNPNGYSAHAKLLPFLDQIPLYNSCNFTREMRMYAAPPENRTASIQRLGVFLCPSDGQADAETAGKTNYAGNRGNGVQKFGYNGAFSFEVDGPIGLEAFTDGTSNTAAMSEWILGPTGFLLRDPERSTFATPFERTKPDQFDEFIEVCRSVDKSTAEIGMASKGALWLQGEFAMTLYNHTMEIGGNTCRNGTAVQQGAWTAGSRHGGGNVLFADGQVRLIKSSVALPVWRSLGSRNGGENLSVY